MASFWEALAEAKAAVRPLSHPGQSIQVLLCFSQFSNLSALLPATPEKDEHLSPFPVLLSLSMPWRTQGAGHYDCGLLRRSHPDHS